MKPFVLALCLPLLMAVPPANAHYPAIAETKLPRTMTVVEIQKYRYRLLNQFEFEVAPYKFNSDHIPNKLGACAYFTVKADNLGIDKNTQGRTHTNFLLEISPSFAKVAGLGSMQVYSDVVKVTNEESFRNAEEFRPAHEFLNQKTGKKEIHYGSATWHYQEYNGSSRFEEIGVDFGNDLSQAHTVMIPVYAKQNSNRDEILSKLADGLKIYRVEDNDAYSLEKKNSEQSFIEFD